MNDILLRDEVDDGIVQLTLNRPERLNALSQALIAALHEQFATISADRTCRVVVLTGAGRGFCAGADVRGNPGEVGAPGTEEIARKPYGLLGKKASPTGFEPSSEEEPEKGEDAEKPRGSRHSAGSRPKSRPPRMSRKSPS